MPTVQDQPKDVSAQAKAQEKENVERAAAATGAQAVANAVAKFAQDVSEKARTESVAGGIPGDFLVTGRPGGRFELRAKAGPIFSSHGSVHVNGRPQTTYEWGADYIRGKFDDAVTDGEVVVQIDEKTKRVGYLKL